MKSLSRILTVCLCCIPAFNAVSSPVATTAGNNLTAYNPSNAYNNQWATISNGRYNNNPTAKADFGNCNAVVLRCAQPKCANGGCTDYNVAAAIVSGCVKSNSKCQQYGDDLVEYMTAQLVANSTAKVNQQQMALEQARIQAEADANAQQSEQISQMQNQMAQMQQQMYQQQQESAQQLQEALAQQAAQSQAAIDNMKTAATEAAKQTEAGISAYQQEAINRGISEDVLARQQITGQIQTEIEDAEVSLKAIKTAMQNAFDYAGCDARGNNCTGPKRIKKWRELAAGFLVPYDTTIDKIYDALVDAQMVGVDLSQIYMMLNNSCNSWGQYLCPSGKVIYPDDDNSNSVPKVCQESTDSQCFTNCNLESLGRQNITSKFQSTDLAVALVAAANDPKKTECIRKCYTKSSCQPCRLLTLLKTDAEVYEGWINAEETSNEQRTVVSCASGVLNSAKLFARRTKNKNGAGLVDIDMLENWIRQTEPDRKIGDDGPEPNKYCSADGNENILESSVLSRVVNTTKRLGGASGGANTFCVNWDRGHWVSEDNPTENGCSYINQVYAICDTHPFNSGGDETWAQNAISADDSEKMHRIIGLKITVISQQMYKQYEYLNATLRRLKTQLQKAVLTSNLEAAGAKSENSSSGGGLVGANNNDDKTLYLAGAENCSNKTSYESGYSCLQTNISLIISSVSSNKKKACQQLGSTLESAKLWLGVNLKENKESNCYKNKISSCGKEEIVSCAQELNIEVIKKKEDQTANKQRSGGWMYQQP